MFDKDYIQYSKRVTSWGVMLITVGMMLCLLLIGLAGLPSASVQAIVNIYTTFATVLGVTIGAYQGNSTLEKWSRAKYQYEDTVEVIEPEDGAAG